MKFCPRYLRSKSWKKKGGRARRNEGERRIESRARYRVVLRIQSEEKGEKKAGDGKVGDGSLHRGPPVSDYRALGPESD